MSVNPPVQHNLAKGCYTPKYDPYFYDPLSCQFDTLFIISLLPTITNKEVLKELSLFYPQALKNIVQGQLVWVHCVLES